MSTRKTTGPRMLRVAPNVTDPSMQNGKTQAEMLLNEMGETNSDVEDVVFQTKNKTREEMSNVTTDNTILIIIFALVVVALVVIIVWMLMRQGNDKKDEDEIRRRIMPHQRNNMPPYGPHSHMQNPHGPHMQNPHGTNMHPSQQHSNLQHQPNKPSVKSKKVEEQDEDSDSEEIEVEVTKKPAKSLSEALKVDQKNKTSNKTSNKTKKQKYDKDNPHPNVLRPGVVSNDETESPKKNIKFDQTDVDDIITRTKAALGDNDMSESDNALLKARNDDSDSSDDE